jgi:hypothetical protein
MAEIEEEGRVRMVPAESQGIWPEQYIVVGVAIA